MITDPLGGNVDFKVRKGLKELIGVIKVDVDYGELYSGLQVYILSLKVGNHLFSDPFKGSLYSLNGSPLPIVLFCSFDDALSYELHRVSEEFREVFEKADVIIAKGQGNFETLSEVKDDRVFYLLKAKCRPIARELNVPQGIWCV